MNQKREQVEREELELAAFMEWWDTKGLEPSIRTQPLSTIARDAWMACAAQFVPKADDARVERRFPEAAVERLTHDGKLWVRENDYDMLMLRFKSASGVEQPVGRSPDPAGREVDGRLTPEAWRFYCYGLGYLTGRSGGDNSAQYLISEPTYWLAGYDQGKADGVSHRMIGDDAPKMGEHPGLSALREKYGCCGAWGTCGHLCRIYKDTPDAPFGELGGP